MTGTVLEFLELIDGDSDKGQVRGHSLGAWPEIDVRRHFYVALRPPVPGHPTPADPAESLAQLYVEYHAGTLRRHNLGIDWDGELYRISEQLAPKVDCTACKPDDGRPRHAAGGLWHTSMDCPTYRAYIDRSCPPGPWGELVPGDFYGCLTACGSAWSINDGPEYCKGCYRTVDPSYDRHEIYRMWEAPDLAHYAERIERLL